MPRLAKAKPTDQSTATIGFEAKLWLAADTAMRDSANLPREAILRSLSEAKDNLCNNMDAAKPERSGDSQPQAARRASEARQYNHAVLGLTARRGSAFPQSEANPQVLSKAKNNMVALPGQLFHSSQSVGQN